MKTTWLGRFWWGAFPRRNLIWLDGLQETEAERLQPMTSVLLQYEADWRGRRVLDVGSNAGHFPLLYARAAAHVTAVEPRKSYRRFFDQKCRPKFTESQRVVWLTENAERWTPAYHYDVVSFLGLLYHLHDGWSHLDRILQAAQPTVVWFDSMLWRDSKERLETGRSNTNRVGLIRKVVTPTREGVEDWFAASGWKPQLMLENWYPACKRGLWRITR